MKPTATPDGVSLCASRALVAWGESDFVDPAIYTDPTTVPATTPRIHGCRCGHCGLESEPVVSNIPTYGAMDSKKRRRSGWLDVSSCPVCGQVWQIDLNYVTRELPELGGGK
jgi:hypothetical protein